MDCRILDVLECHYTSVHCQLVHYSFRPRCWIQNSKGYYVEDIHEQNTMVHAMIECYETCDSVVDYKYSKGIGTLVALHFRLHVVYHHELLMLVDYEGL